jgi:ferredoxin-thioredoxin reductase catalytic subunit/rubredoxin
MNQPIEISPQVVDRVHEHLTLTAARGGYHLNPDVDFVKQLIHGLLVNNKRYGYWSCPCRLSAGNREKDIDIICPCYYRDADVVEHGACYCALYVSEAVLAGKRTLESIPESRPPESARGVSPESPVSQLPGVRLAYPVWRCKVCGYLCARDEPPEVCPVCKVERDRFELFIAKEPT